MNILSHKQISGRLFRIAATALLLICMQATTLQADVTINIKGDIYGGGTEGKCESESGHRFQR